MKAEELMVGNWVRIVDDDTDQSFETRVIGVSGLGNIYASLPDGEHAYPFSVDCVEPIPLTPEILEKNGFRIDEENKWKTRYSFVDNLEKMPQTVVQFSFYEDSRPAFSLFECWTKPYSCDGENSIHICDLKFVHELQHALRLCGIDKEIVV